MILPANLPPFYRRILLFAIGGIGSYLLNAIPYKILTSYFHWHHASAYSLTLACATLLMFLWNYRVNFPTPAIWHQCAVRYVGATLAAYGLNFLAVAWLKPHLPVLLAIFIVGFVIALFKFVLYHLWVFPHRPAAPAQAL